MSCLRISAWSTRASPIRWVLLGIGGLATVVLVLRFGQIAMKLGLASRAVDDFEFTGGQGARTPGRERSIARRFELDRRFVAIACFCFGSELTLGVC